MKLWAARLMCHRLSFWLQILIVDWPLKNNTLQKSASDLIANLTAECYGGHLPKYQLGEPTQIPSNHPTIKSWWMCYRELKPNHSLIRFEIWIFPSEFSDISLWILSHKVFSTMPAQNFTQCPGKLVIFSALSNQLTIWIFSSKHLVHPCASSSDYTHS